MKIALVGDMNNNLFCLTRYLKEKGYEAKLFYAFDNGDHFEPRCDTYDLDFQKYTEGHDWSQSAFYSDSGEQLKDKLKSFDFIISCGNAAAFLNKIGRQIQIYVPYGSDIYKYAHLPQEFNLYEKLKNNLKPFYLKHYQKIDMSQGTIHKYLRQAICDAYYVIAADTNPDFEKKLEQLAIKGKRLHFSIPFVFTHQYQPEIIEKFSDRSYWAKDFKRLRQQHEMIVFHHSRQIWKSFPNAYSFKGNDKLINGFAKFVKGNPDVKACLVMMEYGPDVLESKKLIQELGIEEHVRWFPKMYRKDIMIGLHYADICTGEFDKSWLMFGTIMEGMAMAKPILHHRRDALYQNSYPELYPIMNAKHPEEIEKALSDYAQNPEQHKQMGEECRQWHQKYIVEEPLKQIFEIIKEYA